MSGGGERGEIGRAAVDPAPDGDALGDHVALVDLVNRVLDRGVCVTGDVVVSVAGIDLLYVELRVLLSSVETLEGTRRGPEA